MQSGVPMVLAPAPVNTIAPAPGYLQVGPPVAVEMQQYSPRAPAMGQYPDMVEVKDEPPEHQR